MVTQLLAALSARTRKHAPQAASPSSVRSVSGEKFKRKPSQAPTKHCTRRWSGLGSYLHYCKVSKLTENRSRHELQATVRSKLMHGLRYNMYSPSRARNKKEAYSKAMASVKVGCTVTQSASGEPKHEHVKVCHVHMHENSKRIERFSERTSGELDVRSQKTCPAASSSEAGSSPRAHRGRCRSGVVSRVAPQQSKRSLQRSQPPTSQQR